MLRSITTRIPLLLTALALAGTAHASLIPLAQTRTVFAGGSATVDSVTVSDSQSHTAPNFGVFASSAGVAVRNDPATLDAFAGQNSTILPFHVSMTGLADALATTGAFDQQASGSARSRFELSFDVVTSSLFQLDAFSNSIGSALPFFSLTGPGVSIEVGPFSDPEFHGLVSFAPGSYTLIAEASAGVFASDGRSSARRSDIGFDLTEVPEPGTALLLAAGCVAMTRGHRRGAHVRTNA